MKIGVDGGGTKTELILVDDGGAIVAKQIAPGCNPSVVGADQAKLVLTEALRAMICQPALSQPGRSITASLFCMAGSQSFWHELTAPLKELGRITVFHDAMPVLELATDGSAGLVLHAGTGSFVAARAPDGATHYAGGLGWRFGDPGSGYDLGRRAISRALLELQGWMPASRIGVFVRDQTGLGNAGEITRFFYHDPAPNPKISAFAPGVIRLAAEGDHTAHALVVESTAELLDLARSVAEKLFGATTSFKAGVSGPILTNPVVMQALAPRVPFPLVPVVEAPIEGVRRLLLRAAV